MNILKRNIKVIIPVMVIIMSIVSCKKLSSYDYPEQASTYGIIKEDISFTTFRSLIDRAGMREMLEGGQYTVFAPTNGAFSSAGFTSDVFRAMSDEEVQTLVKNHIVSGAVDVRSMSGTLELTGTSNRKMFLQKIGDAIYVDGGDVTNPSFKSTNGYLNMINKVLISKTTLFDAISAYAHGTANSQLTFLAAAIARASTGSTNIEALLKGSDAYTFFAPINAAFIAAGYANLAAIQTANANTLGNLLKYQFVPGRKLTTAFDSIPVNSHNGIPIYFDKVKETRTSYWFANGVNFGNGGSANIETGNGIMHLVPRLFPVPIATNTIATIQADASLSLFYTLIQRASQADPKYNFASMLSDPKSSYTVFAVNNTGLTAAGYPTVTAINSENPEVLANMMKFHIIPKRMNNGNLAENGTVNTLYKTKDALTGKLTTYAITFSSSGGFKVKGLNNPTTIPVIADKANIVTTNGLLNVVGTVLLP